MNEERDPAARIEMSEGILLWLLTIGAMGAALALYVIKAPSGTDLVSLQWADSARSADALVSGRIADYRTAVNWDLVLNVMFPIGTVVACVLGRRVFWTSGLLGWSAVGIAVGVIAGLCGIAQDITFLSMIHSDHLQGLWVFRIVETLSFVKFTGAVAATSISLIALGTTVSRVFNEVTRGKDWRVWAEQQRSSRNRESSPAVVPPPRIEIPPLGKVRKPQKRPKLIARLWKMLWRDQLPRPVDHSWWNLEDRGAAPVHWSQDTSLPMAEQRGDTAICVSGGGIRSASVALGALQGLRTKLDGSLGTVDELVSVSGGGYTNGGIQLALHAPDPEAGLEPCVLTADAKTVFEPGSPEEDHLRRHSSYLSDGPAQWLVALGVLLRNLLGSLLVIGLTISVVGLAVGRFYREIPIVSGGLTTLPTKVFSAPKAKAPGYPSIPWGVTLGIVLLLSMAVVLYLVELVWMGQRGSRPPRLARIASVATGGAVFLAALGIAIPAVVWASSWLTWHLGIGSKPLIAIGGVSGALSYVAVVVAALSRKKKYVSDFEADLKKGQNVVSGVFPNSMIQKVLMWITLVVLGLLALVICGWVATSGLDNSWWALLIVGPLLFLSIFLDQTSMSLHPFYRRRLASAFAVRRVKDGGIDVAQPYPYSEVTTLSYYATKPEGWPMATFAASANLNGQNRTTPGRPTVSYALRSDYVGGPQVGWIRTDFLEEIVSKSIRHDLTVEAAVAISGAAIASAMGAQTRYYEIFFALTNVRLGAWLPNPYFVALKLANADDWTVPDLPRVRRLSYFAREIFGIHPSTSRLLLCTDGGHYDNLGLVETLRRRCKLVYCFDASGATSPMADTLSGALMLAREELGVEITFPDAYDLVPGSSTPLDPTGPFTKLNARMSKSAIITGTIHYPKLGPNRPAFDGTLIFAQADLVNDLPYDILEFTQDDPAFPNDSTADQWFDCDKFDAYERLGRYLGT